MMFSLFLVACEQLPDTQTNLDVLAHWDAETATLHISGKANTANADVEIHDAITGEKLGSAIVNADGSWAASTSASACKVHVQLASGTATVNVKDAPVSCSTTASSLSQRVIAA
ncbi:MAG: hypothetical protein R3240_07320, partial [Gammaproteobacteria bacterium]|nr:hypothetical protein [Gammaproteobacteria bacterium]